MQDNKWIEITFVTTSEAVEALSAILYDAGAGGVAIEDPKDIKEYNTHPGDWDYIDEKLFPENMDDVKVKGYLCDTAETGEKISHMKEAFLKLKEYGIDIGKGSVHIKEVMEQDWANAWKQYYKPFKIGEHIVIKPSWEEYEKQPDDMVIELDPGMAFGTGAHETTRMCIELLERYINKDDIVFDVGCGSGILSIVSSMLGARKVTGIDIDLVAVSASRENVKISGAANIEILHGNLLDMVHGRANVVVSNIIADVIIGLCPEIPNFLLPEGVFICSGIIADMEEDVKKAIESSGFKILNIERQGEWVAIASKMGV